MYIFPLGMLENVWDYLGLSGNVGKCRKMSGNVWKYWKDKRPPQKGWPCFYIYINVELLQIGFLTMQS